MVPEPRWEQMEQRARCQLARRKVFVTLGREAWQVPGVALQAVGCSVQLYSESLPGLEPDSPTFPPSLSGAL